MANGAPRVPERYGNAMISGAASLVPIVTFAFWFSGQIASLATEQEVAEMIAAHTINGMHPQATEVVGELTEKLNASLALQYQSRIEALIKLQCENPQLRPQVEPAISNLIQEHDKVAAARYRRPSCIELGAV